jgi:hypothetical protein
VVDFVVASARAVTSCAADVVYTVVASARAITSRAAEVVHRGALVVKKRMVPTSLARWDSRP